MRIVVQVKPRARVRKMEKIDDGHYKAWVTPAPAGGKANDALVELVAEEFGVAKSRVRIVIGKTAREKLVEIAE